MLATLHTSEPTEALSREAALMAYTAGGAYAEGQDQRKGRIAPGFAADIAVLSQDVLTIPPPQLPATSNASSNESRPGANARASRAG
jgi:predicted amidohydrolase YtcJ